MLYLNAEVGELSIRLKIKTRGPVNIQNLVQNGQVVSEKIWFEFLYVHNLGPRISNDLDL